MFNKDSCRPKFHNETRHLMSFEQTRRPEQIYTAIQEMKNHKIYWKRKKIETIFV